MYAASGCFFSSLSCSYSCYRPLSAAQGTAYRVALSLHPCRASLDIPSPQGSVSAGTSAERVNHLPRHDCQSQSQLAPRLPGYLVLGLDRTLTRILCLVRRTFLIRTTAIACRATLIRSKHCCPAVDDQDVREPAKHLIQNAAR